MAKKRLKLSLPADPRSLHAIREVIEGFISDTVYKARESDILLVTSEACANVIRHAYNTECKKPLIILICTMKSNSLTILVCDKGNGMGAEKSNPCFSENGGFGFFIMRKLSDEFRCYASRLGTIVRVKYYNTEYAASKKKNTAVFLPYRLTCKLIHLCPHSYMLFCAQGVNLCRALSN